MYVCVFWPNPGAIVCAWGFVIDDGRVVTFGNTFFCMHTWIMCVFYSNLNSDCILRDFNIISCANNCLSAVVFYSLNIYFLSLAALYAEEDMMSALMFPITFKWATSQHFIYFHHESECRQTSFVFVIAPEQCRSGWWLYVGHNLALHFWRWPFVERCQFLWLNILRCQQPRRYDGDVTIANAIFSDCCTATVSRIRWGYIQSFGCVAASCWYILLYNRHR